MQSVVMFAAGATAGVLAMHCVSRAREKFEPGAACELQREGDRRVASGLRRALVWRGLQRFQWRRGCGAWPPSLQQQLQLPGTHASLTLRLCPPPWAAGTPGYVSKPPHPDWKPGDKLPIPYGAPPRTLCTG